MEEVEFIQQIMIATPPKKTMFNYFSRLPPKTTIEENPRKAAPLLNKQHVERFQAGQDKFDDEILSSFNGSTNDQNYLKTLKSGEYKPFSTHKSTRGPMRAHLLQFHHDIRPPYFGTWQKKSKLVTARRPFGQDTQVFDYEVDSEAEWDIGGPGDSIKGDDSEDDETDLPNEDDAGLEEVFVPDGYLSNDELDSDDDDRQFGLTEFSTKKGNMKPIVMGINNLSDADVNFLSRFSCVLDYCH